MIANAPVVQTIAKKGAAASTPKSGEASILKPMTLFIVGFADAIAVLTVANTGPLILKHDSTTLLTCDSGAPAAAWPPL